MATRIKKKQKLKVRTPTPAYNWYAAFILPKADIKILEYIECNDLCQIHEVKGWYPKRKVIIFKKGKRIIAEEPLYPNYMLFYLPKDDTKIHILLKENTPIIKFIADQETKKLFPLSHADINKTIELCDQVVNHSIQELIGKKVYIKKGPYKTMIGFVKSLIKDPNITKARLIIDIFGSVLTPEINVDYLEEVQ